MKKILLGIFINAILWIGHAAHAGPVLSLDRALQLAESRSRQLTAQDAAATASREMGLAAGQLPDPTLKFGVNNLPINGEDRFSLTQDFMTMRSVGVMQEITRSDKLKVRSARFNREAEAAEASRAVALANLRRDTAMAWLDRYYQERMLDVLRTQRTEAGLQIEAADAAYRGGRGTQADVFAARSMVAQIDDRIRQTEKQIGTAKIRLARWVGDDAAQALDTPPSLQSVHLDLSSLDSQLAHHPEIALMTKQEQVARADADIAQSNKRADWSVELMYSQRGPAYSNMVSVNVSVPLQWDQKNRQDRELSAKLAIAEQMRAQREEATREHVADTRMWLQEWQSNRERLAQYDSALIPLAAERTRAAIAAYRGGSGPLTVVLEARRMAIDTQMDRLRLEMEAAALWAQLEYLIPAEHQTTTEPRLPSLPTTTATEK
ncbi:TolC family protein [Extensimonas sp. H3M7-6]|uniref:TolC family protein n=1 Tax=Extensimonas soli TaxID=3031322 RepID=UPI0023D9894E|nr:TolC family protein [Extensimonas sp. H3M7-6]MDF1483205.1 TolC family protein [Extensimonas sp. H3M7-6]